MTYLMQHLWPGGNEARYNESIKALHPPGTLPAGQIFHAAAVVDEGVIITALWNSKEEADTFVSEVLIPTLPIEGGLDGEPQERAGEAFHVENA
ncbi:MAG: hypothetical protein WCI34_05290 [Actinomycetes bacterium]